MQVVSDPKRHLVLHVEGIEVTAPPGVIYEVYVGLPSRQKPHPDAPYYVGNVAPFGAEMSHGEFVQAFPIKAAAERLLVAKPKEVGITFVPRGPLDAQGRDTPVKLTGQVRFKQVRVIVQE